MNRPNVESLKRELRRSFAALRDGLTPAERAEKSALLCEAVAREALLPLESKAGRPLVVCAYGAFRSEADPSGVREWCRGRGHLVIAPRVREDGEGMELRTVASPADWAPGRWGVPEPNPERTAPYPMDGPIDVVLVPGLAFDFRGGRLGYGGSYYDRLYAEREEAGANAALWLGFAFGLQKVGKLLPKEPHDLPLGGLATEDGILWF
jgi:5-formyltetrahydrofolate cyclo-ligase